MAVALIALQRCLRVHCVVLAGALAGSLNKLPYSKMTGRVCFGNSIPAVTFRRSNQSTDGVITRNLGINALGNDFKLISPAPEAATGVIWTRANIKGTLGHTEDGFIRINPVQVKTVVVNAHSAITLDDIQTDVSPPF